ncbi:MAG: hypothetical protein JWM80_2570 [Cyanobacteria bacterium RYN_339]|nr:hypothetical protein [Cyanobacteria bacterium RYN_339]
MPTSPALSLLASFALALAAPASSPQIAQPAQDVAPPISREFRGAWVATVANIDWPSRAGLPPAQQQAELIAILDRSVALKLNAVVLQVRPACDALYDSPYEPWSEFLTGRMGKAPVPYYDPLAFAVAQAHARGLELHAWFNPYRARMPDSGPAAPNHISKTRPDLVKPYGKYLWLDPGEPDVQAHSLRVMLDVVHRYDIDAVHMDDYFYPYREPLYTVGRRSGLNKTRYQPFPDDASYGRYRAAGGALNRDDWRRDNVNHFIQTLYREVKQAKPWVKVGLSPFGIWKPGNPKQIKGMSQYDAIYADARLWLRAGWCDYFVPQLYWPIENPDQSYPVLLDWWTKQNFQGRHLWPGLFTSRVGDDSGSPWDPKQVLFQIAWTRLNPGASGHVHFSMKSLMANRSGLSDRLVEKPYAASALVPASPWLAGKRPAKPLVTFVRDPRKLSLAADWQSGDERAPWLWAVYVEKGTTWTTHVLPAGQHTLELDFAPGAPLPHAMEVAAVDRCGIESDRARFVFGTPTPARP